MSTGTRRRGWMLVVGIIVVIGGLVAAGALWYAGGQRLDDNVAGFARAPSGCATTLDFDRAGGFTLYVETVGTLDQLAGDCSAATEYDRESDVEPVLDLVDPDGNEVSIEPASGSDYDAGGFVGEQIGVVEIESPGDHVLTVGADGALFSIAVGAAVDDGVAVLRWWAVIVAIVALLAGGLLLVVGSRRPPAPASSVPAWQPDGPTSPAWPAGPPGFPAPPPTTGATAPVGPRLVAPPSGPTAPPEVSPPTPPRRASSPSAPEAEPADPPTWGPPSTSS